MAERAERPLMERWWWFFLVTAYAWVAIIETAARRPGDFLELGRGSVAVLLILVGFPLWLWGRRHEARRRDRGDVHEPSPRMRRIAEWLGPPLSARRWHVVRLVVVPITFVGAVLGGLLGGASAVAAAAIGACVGVLVLSAVTIVERVVVRTVSGAST
jgi:hypothetical protein